MIGAGLFDFLNRLTDWLDEVSSNWWFILVIFIIALLDSVVPVVPSETTVIVGGIAAGQGDLWLPLVIAMGATGAFAGDSIAYFLGKRARPLVLRVIGRRGNGEERLSRAAAQIDKRGGLLLITARFIPGGRTLMTVSCGATERPYKRWFVPWDALAATLWASYAAIIGFFFGGIFEDNHSTAFWLAFATALSITLLIELVRWLRARRASTEASAGAAT
ncbi:MAG: DedA family protein [Actinomycetota bacterium]